MTQNFYTLITNVGKAKIANYNVLGKTVNITKIQVGDGGGAYYEPTENQTSLVHQVWEGPIGNKKLDEQNKNHIVAEAIIPTDIGGFTIREAGLVDEDGDLIVIAKYPQTYKPQATDGVVKELFVKLIFEVSNASAVNIQLDKTVILATQKEVSQLEKKITNHISSKITTIDGAHGARYHENTLQFYDEIDNKWVNNGEGFGTPPKDVTKLAVVEEGDGFVTIKWSDPIDENWVGTKLVAKAGSYPENVNDGILAIDNKVANAYAETGFKISGLTNFEKYYFQAFPYNASKSTNNNKVNRITGTPFKTIVMTVVIDQANSNPETSCTYADDAVSMTPKSAQWDSFFGHYPCLFKDGKETFKLNPNDFTKKIDGTNADIINGVDGDVMIAFPRMGIKLNTVDNLLYVSMTNAKNDPNYSYLAHTRGTIARDKFYIGAYKGWYDGTKMRSLSNKMPIDGHPGYSWAGLDKSRIFAQKNGIGYEQIAYYQVLYRQVMYLLKYKNLDSQTAVGMGYTASSNTTKTLTGGTDKKGMDFGESTGKLQMKLFGMEDFWGNLTEWVDGILIDTSGYMYFGTNNFNGTGLGYKKLSVGFKSGYISKVQGDNDKGFLASTVNGSASTYYCDYGDYRDPKNGSDTYYTGHISQTYNSYNNSTPTLYGIFYMPFMHSTGSSNDTLGYRLMYL